MVASALISAGASLLGGMFNRNAQQEFNEQQAKQAALNMKMQQDFAQHGIKWKVDDARDAGIHPLYALGANTTSYSPVTVGGAPDTSLGSAMASAGQDLSRAMDATRSSKERSEAVASTAAKLQLENAGLQNDLLRVQIAKMRAQVGPPLPSGNEVEGIPGQPQTRAVSLPGNLKVNTDVNESTQDAISKEYGDEGLPQIPGQYRFVRDVIAAWYADQARQQTPAREQARREWTGRWVRGLGNYFNPKNY